MIMIVSVTMVMNNHGTVCIEQTQVLNSKGIDPGSHVVAMIIVVVVITMGMERFCCNHTINLLGKKLSTLYILKAFNKISLADQNIVLISNSVAIGIVKHFISFLIFSMDHKPCLSIIKIP